MNERNRTIKDFIESGRKPMLRYEFEMAQEQFDVLIQEQNALSLRMAEATTQSSETYHDNSPFDAANEDAIRLSSIAEKLIEKLSKEGVPLSDIYIDPLVRPISTGIHYGNVAIDTIREVKKEFPNVHIACGLSNISFSLPARKLINVAFLVSAIGAGMDGAIIDPLDKKLMSMIYASEALFGKDNYCKNYLKKYRSGEIHE